MHILRAIDYLHKNGILTEVIDGGYKITNTSKNVSINVTAGALIEYAVHLQTLELKNKMGI